MDLLEALNAYINVINKQYNDILYLTPKHASWNNIIAL
jgi:hypothetical protein